METAQITNSPAALQREIAKAGKHPRVVLEATYGWYRAADVLEETGAKVHLAHPHGDLTRGLSGACCKARTNIWRCDRLLARPGARFDPQDS